MMILHTIIWMISVQTFVIGISVSFVPNKPKLGDDVTITCTRTSTSTSAISWGLDTNVLTTCDGTTDNTCIPPPTGYTVSTDVSENVFNLTSASLSVSDCKSYTCTDTVTTTDTDTNDLQVAYFDKNSVTTTEPGANTDGVISLTTGCVLSASDVTITWSLIENGIQTDYTSDRPSPVYSTARSTCTRTCHTEEDKVVTSGFTHTEYTGSDSVEVEYKVTIAHSSYTLSTDYFTWTSAKYKLKGPTTTTTTTTTTSSTTNNSTVRTVTTSTTTSTTTSSNNTSDDIGIIVGASVGSVAFLGSSCCIFVCCWLRRKTNKKKGNPERIKSDPSYDNDIKELDLMRISDTRNPNLGQKN